MEGWCKVGTKHSTLGVRVKLVMIDRFFPLPKNYKLVVNHPTSLHIFKMLIVKRKFRMEIRCKTQQWLLKKMNDGNIFV